MLHRLKNIPKTEKNRPVFAVAGLLLAWLTGFGGCTTDVKPESDPVPPDYAFAPHPDGWDEADLHAIFYDKRAPDIQKMKTCDADYQKLRKATRADEELNEGLREMVTKDPVGYHWCFYGRLSWLDEELKEIKFVDEKQKRVLDTFEFLVPVARVYTNYFNDSRYLRWAVLRYKHLSEWVFFRKLTLTPRTTADLVEMSNPYGLVRPPVGKTNILDKYNIEPRPLFTPGTAQANAQVSPSPAPPTAPLAAASPSPAPTPSSAPAAQNETAPALEPGTGASPQPAPSQAAAPSAETPAAAAAAQDHPPGDPLTPPPAQDTAQPANPVADAPPLPGDNSAAAPRAPAGQSTN